MSFSRSGNPGPGFSYPIGIGVFTDVLASNTVFSTYFRGDGGFLSNVNSQIPGTLPNLVVSNSLTTTNVFASIYRGGVKVLGGARCPISNIYHFYISSTEGSQTITDDTVCSRNRRRKKGISSHVGIRSPRRNHTQAHLIRHTTRRIDGLDLGSSQNFVKYSEVIDRPVKSICIVPIRTCKNLSHCKCVCKGCRSLKNSIKVK